MCCFTCLPLRMIPPLSPPPDQSDSSGWHGSTRKYFIGFYLRRSRQVLELWELLLLVVVVVGSSLLTIGLKKLLVAIIQLSSQLKFSSGWDLSHLYTVHTYTMAFVRVKYLNIYEEDFWSFLLQYVDMLSMAQVFEQSLFLCFFLKKY